MSLEDTVPFQEILGRCSLNENPQKTLRGHIDGTITTGSGMPSNPTPEEVIVYRKKPELVVRENQLMINTLGLEGGRPYVGARLSRYAGETEIDWIGGKRPDGSCSTGRLQQTHAFPYLGRIAGKINQHVFQTCPVRKDADPDVERDITRDGSSVNDIMREVSKYLYATGWCWIGVDAPPSKADGSAYSVQDKESGKIRPYWQFYNPMDVLDWFFDEKGELQWIKTQGVEYDDSDPSTQPTPKRIISLWEKGKVTKYTVEERTDRRYSGNMRTSITSKEIPLMKSNGQPMDVIPFVLCGDVSAGPIAFDDLESINRTIMDLGSVDRANFFNAAYPQLVLPASLMNRAVQDGYANCATEVAKLIIGFKYPITVENDDIAPSYLMPDGGSLESVSKRIDSLKMDMFEVVGMSLEQGSRQVASAEAKAWDFLDVAAVMSARAETLEEIEKKVIAISKQWDDSFQTWEPQYNRDFDIGDFQQEINAIVMAGNMNVPTEVSREIVKKLVDRLDRIGTKISSDDKQVILDAINVWNPNDFAETLAIQEP